MLCLTVAQLVGLPKGLDYSTDKLTLVLGHDQLSPGFGLDRALTYGGGAGFEESLG